MTAPAAPPEFSPGDVALEGFRLTREHPQVIPAWAALLFVVSLLSTWALVSSGYMASMTTFMETVQKGAQPDMTALNAVSLRLIQKMLVVFPVMLVFDALIRTAIARMVLTPQDRGLAYLKLGVEELLVFVTRILITLILIGFGMVAGVVIGGSVAALGAAGALIAVIAFFGLIGALIVVQIRLSLTTPATFATRSIGLGASWRMTKGRMGPLLGTYVIAIVLFLVVQVVGMVITSVIQMAAGGASGAIPTDFKDYLTVPQLIGEVVGAVFSALGVLILHSPAAVIYRRLSGADMAKVTDAF